MTPHTPHTLDALTLPLRGSRLIEASAGTGKTWTIAALYLRLVLGHGGEAGFGRALAPSEILVMTFTRAATRELSDRIRLRLVQAACCFRGEVPPDQIDSLMARLLTDYPEGSVRARAARRLALAAESMDDAAVYTIDAWCQRMLREHAFDSGSLFDEDLVANEAAMLRDAAQDHWRQQIYPLPPAALNAVLSLWPTPDELARDAKELLGQALPPGAGKGSTGDVIAQWTADRATQLARLKTGWAAQAADMKQWIDEQIQRPKGQCPLVKTKFKAGTYSRWLDSVAAWAGDPLAEDFGIGVGRERLIPGGMWLATEEGHTLDLPPPFSAFEQLLIALKQLPTLVPRLRAHAAACIGQRLAALKEQSGSFGFADMLERLDQALDAGPAGGQTVASIGADIAAAPAVAAATALTAASGAAAPVAVAAGTEPARKSQHEFLHDSPHDSPEDAPHERALRLRARLLARFPVALIDEFQDTSPIQARIFDRIYRLRDNDPQTALLLIGDPKQSIYGFRGADIHSYLAARRATAGRHEVLGTNHRSTERLVAAVNRVFLHAESHSQGAFMYRDEAAAGDNPLPFTPVAAQGRAEAFVTAAGPVTALTFNVDANLLDGKSHQRHFAARCAERIVTLLNDPQAGFADPRPEASVRFTRLRPADIAVLVRTGKEAAAVRRELRRRSVASVYLSDKESVFRSTEAQDLLRWLKAVAEPLDARKVRAALATRLAGLSINEMIQLANDDEAFDARGEQFRQLHAVWQTQGVLSMLRQALHGLGLPARWLNPATADPAAAGSDRGGGLESGTGSDSDGERRLTNVLHLAELLQVASAQLDGERALIRWMAEQMAEGAAGTDEQIVRLESDADLVKVVTIYKSKGLEYPLVFLPFASAFRPVDKRGTRFVSLADATGQRHLHLDLPEEVLKAADQDRLREDLRLLYVALTRARHALWVGVAALKMGQGKDCVFQHCALGYVAAGGHPVSADELPAHLGRVAHGCCDIACVPADAPGRIARTTLRVRASPGALRELPPYAANFERRWTIGSFSALVRALAGPVASPLLTTAALAIRDDEGAGASAGARSAAAADVHAPWHAFPRGAVPGNFLHDQLEWLASQPFALDESPDLQRQLLRRCERLGWGHQAEAVQVWLSQIARTHLPPVGTALATITTGLPEMEFWFPSEGLASAEVDALCRRHWLGGRDRPALPEREWRGMLMGFADLVFEHGGRFWVLDYKSNHLGSTDADYTLDALESAMAAHRYDVQAALYLLALHRLLRARLGAAYDPAQHLGGAVYFFLRGLHGPAHGCYLVPPSLPLLNALDAKLAGRAEAAS